MHCALLATYIQVLNVILMQICGLLRTAQVVCGAIVLVASCTTMIVQRKIQTSVWQWLKSAMELVVGDSHESAEEEEGRAAASGSTGRAPGPPGRERGGGGGGRGRAAVYGSMGSASSHFGMGSAAFGSE